MFRPDFLHRAVAFATFPAGVGHIFFGDLFIAGEFDLFGIDNDDKVAEVEVGGEARFVLTPENVCYLDSQTAENRAFGVDHVPFPVFRVRFGNQCFHPILETKERGT